MIDALHLLASLSAGTVLGILYFRGLWKTVLRLPDFRNPARSVSLSFAARAILVVTGFFLIMQGRTDRLAAALAGFLIARQILIHRLGKFSEPH